MVAAQRGRDGGVIENGTRKIIRDQIVSIWDPLSGTWVLCQGNREPLKDVIIVHGGEVMQCAFLNAHWLLFTD